MKISLKRTLLLAAVSGAAGSAALGQNVVVPNSFAGTPGVNGLNTFIRDTGNPRTGQLLIDSSEMAAVPPGSQITGITFRLWSGSTTPYPATDATWAAYDVYMGTSVLPSSGSTTFASNVVGSLTQVRSGPLTIPAATFSSTGTPRPWGFEIQLSSPYVYTGGHLLIEVRHTGSNIVNVASDFLDVAEATATLNRSFTATGNTATVGGANTFTVSRLTYVPGGGVFGACCLPNLSCAVLSPADCTTQNGTYRGDGTNCATANCPTPGACCLALGVCAQTSAAGCTAQGGIYRGDSTSCATANCPGGVNFDCTIPGTFTDISATGAALGTGDDATFAFTSSVTNSLVTNPNLFACTNGFISNSATFATFTNTPLPTASATFGLFPNWDDLYVDPALTPPSSLRHQALVEGGIPVHIIQWNMVRTFAAQTPVTQGSFQVKIWGAGGPALVQYLYQGMAWDWNGNSSTVGVQWGPAAFFQKSYSDINAAPPPPGQIPDNSVCSIVAVGAPAACYANCDSSTQQPCLNVLDFSCFLNKFAAQDTYANCDQSTQPPVLNVLDFSCFLNQFAAGCSSC